jgi:hypothetical protein
MGGNTYAAYGLRITDYGLRMPDAEGERQTTKRITLPSTVHRQREMKGRAMIRVRRRLQLPAMSFDN